MDFWCENCDLYFKQEQTDETQHIEAECPQCGGEYGLEVIKTSGTAFAYAMLDRKEEDGGDVLISLEKMQELKALVAGMSDAFDDDDFDLVQDLIVETWSALRAIQKGDNGTSPRTDAVPVTEEELSELNRNETKRLLKTISDSLNTLRFILQAGDENEDVWGNLRDARLLLGEARDKLSGFK